VEDSTGISLLRWFAVARVFVRRGESNEILGVSGSLFI